MYSLTLAGCMTQPFGSYLKSLGVLRLVCEQADADARAKWDGNTLILESVLSTDSLTQFFLQQYRPTPILAPWNGGSGFYPKDSKAGIEAIAGSSDERFTEYGDAIRTVRRMAEVNAGKSAQSEDVRRTAILRKCRNTLPDRAVEWLDASVAIAADGSRSFAPVLGTGGNEGRLDYTNNFMERVAGLLLCPDKKTRVDELLWNALFGTATESLQAHAAAGQYDPGRAGGANQGEGLEGGVATNPWDFVLTLEGAVAWASGLYRRQGVAYESVLCSPFTVRATRVGYGSAGQKDDARAEIWAPIWANATSYAELKVLLREGRASVDGKPARNGMEFAEAATSLGVDRGIQRFVRYSLLKRRGDSYVALPAGEFHPEYRSESDLVRKLDSVLARIGLASGNEARSGVDRAMFEVLLRGGAKYVRAMLAAFGRLLRRNAATGRSIDTRDRMDPSPWLDAAGFADEAEVRIAAGIASIRDRDIGGIRSNLSGDSRAFAWTGRDLPDRMIQVIHRRVQLAVAAESKRNPFDAACRVRAGDATSFIEGSTDDELIEDLSFAFTALDWSRYERRDATAPREVLPVYALLKHLFLPGPIVVDGEEKRLRSDLRVVSWLSAGKAYVPDAARLAKQALKVAGLRPIEVWYEGGVDSRRLAAALLIPIRSGGEFSSAVLHARKETSA